MIDNEAESRGWRGIATGVFRQSQARGFLAVRRRPLQLLSCLTRRSPARLDSVGVRTMGRHCTALERSSMGTMREEESHDPYGSIHGRWTCAGRIGGFGAKHG